MALLPAPLSSPSSSSSSSSSSSTLRPFCCFLSKSPFLVGFSLAVSKPKPIARTAVASFPVITKRSGFVVRAQQQEEEEEEQAQEQQSQPQPEERKKKDRKKHLSLVPLDQRWLFEEPELDGPDIWNNTWYPKAADHVNTDKTWYVVDATDKILGRLASTIAIHIRGKNLAIYTPSVDMGAFVIVVNAEKIAVSGKKRTQKLYRRHSGRPGGMKVETFDQLQQRIPERIIEHAVRGMLPKGRLGRALFNHLKVYKGPSHPHEAQLPIPLPIRDKRVQKQT